MLTDIGVGYSCHHDAFSYDSRYWLVWECVFDYAVSFQCSQYCQTFSNFEFRCATAPLAGKLYQFYNLKVRSPVS